MLATLTVCKFLLLLVRAVQIELLTTQVFHQASYQVLHCHHDDMTAAE